MHRRPAPANILNPAAADVRQVAFVSNPIPLYFHLNFSFSTEQMAYLAKVLPVSLIVQVTEGAKVDPVTTAIVSWVHAQYLTLYPRGGAPPLHTRHGSLLFTTDTALDAFPPITYHISPKIAIPFSTYCNGEIVTDYDVSNAQHTAQSATTGCCPYLPRSWETGFIHTQYHSYRIDSLVACDVWSAMRVTRVPKVKILNPVGLCAIPKSNGVHRISQSGSAVLHSHLRDMTIPIEPILLSFADGRIAIVVWPGYASLPLPLSLISELTTKSVFRERTRKMLDNLGNLGKHLAEKTTLPSAYLAMIMPMIIALALTDSLGREINSLTYISSYSSEVATVNSQLKDPFTPVYTLTGYLTHAALRSAVLAAAVKTCGSLDLRSFLCTLVLSATSLIAAAPSRANTAKFSLGIAAIVAALKALTHHQFASGLNLLRQAGRQQNQYVIRFLKYIAPFLIAHTPRIYSQPSTGGIVTPHVSEVTDAHNELGIPYADICCERMPLPPLRDGCAYTPGPNFTCRQTASIRACGIVLSVDQTDLIPPIAHSTCSHNQQACSRTRMLCERIEPIRGYYENTLLNYTLENSAAIFPYRVVIPVKLLDWINKFPKSRASLYKAELDEMAVVLYQQPPCKVQIEPKKEKLNLPPGTVDPDVAKKPRAVSSVSPRHQLVICRHIYALTKLLALNWGFKIEGAIGQGSKLPPPIVYAGGMSLCAMGNWFTVLHTHFPLFVVVSLDQSKMDLHHGLQAMKYQFAVYDQVFHLPKHVLRQLNKQAKPVLKTRDGSKIRCTPITLSGSLTTTCGNTLVNSINTYYQIMSRFPHARIFLLTMGDDIIAFVDPEVSLWLSTLGPAAIAETGFKAEVQAYAEPSEADFCSKRAWPARDGDNEIFMFAPKFSMLNKLFYGLSVPEGEGDSWCRGVAMGLNNDMHHVEPMRMIFEKVLELTRGKKTMKIYDPNVPHVSKRYESSPERLDRFLTSVYDFPDNWREILASDLAKITKLPAVLHTSFLIEAVKRDLSDPYIPVFPHPAHPPRAPPPPQPVHRFGYPESLRIQLDEQRFIPMAFTVTDALVLTARVVDTVKGVATRVSNVASRLYRWIRSKPVLPFDQPVPPSFDVPNYHLRADISDPVSYMIQRYSASIMSGEQENHHEHYTAVAHGALGHGPGSILHIYLYCMIHARSQWLTVHNIPDIVQVCDHPISFYADTTRIRQQAARIYEEQLREIEPEPLIIPPYSSDEEDENFDLPFIPPPPRPDPDILDYLRHLPPIFTASNCGICQDGITMIDRPNYMCRIACDHIFCNHCIVQCYVTGNNSCPLCRAPIIVRAPRTPPTILEFAQEFATPPTSDEDLSRPSDEEQPPPPREYGGTPN